MLIYLNSFSRLLVLCFFLQSCAWSEKWFNKSGSVDNSQLEKVGAKEEELTKFAVTEEPPAVVTKEEPVLPKVAEKPKPQVTLKKAQPTKKTPPPPPVKSPAFTYPVDFPEPLKDLDKLAADSWKLIDTKYLSNEEMFLDVDYLGMTVGKVVLSYRGLKSIQGKPVHHFQAFFKSAPFYSAIYELDDKLDTYVDKEQFVSLRYNLVQRESKQDVDEVQLYDRDTLTTSAYQKRVVKGEAKNKKWNGFIPRYSIDALSVLWLIRSMPLVNGEKYILPVVNKGKTLKLEATVEKREKITVKMGTFSAIKVRAHTVYTGKTLKSGDMTFWISDDPRRVLLRAQAKIKIGSVFAEAVKGP